MENIKTSPPTVTPPTIKPPTPTASLIKRDRANYIIPALSLGALIIVFLKSAKTYSVESIESPGFILAFLCALPYLITFLFSFYVKNENQRKVFYAAIGFLAFMTAFEWIGPKTPQMKNIYSIIWFFQLVFVVPFLIYGVTGTEKNE